MNVRSTKETDTNKIRNEMEKKMTAMQEVIEGYVTANQNDKEQMKGILTQLHKMETDRFSN